MNIDRAACREAWQAYLRSLPAQHPHHLVKPDAFGFGVELGLADELAELVLAGRKRATTSLPSQYAVLQRPAPEAGNLSLILRGNGRPAAIIERTQVTTIPFADVDEAYAAIEGEGTARWRSGGARTRRISAPCARSSGANSRSAAWCCVRCFVSSGL